jgi:hypothetical protein
MMDFESLLGASRPALLLAPQTSSSGDNRVGDPEKLHAMSQSYVQLLLLRINFKQNMR